MPSRIVPTCESNSDIESKSRELEISKCIDVEAKSQEKGGSKSVEVRSSVGTQAPRSKKGGKLEHDMGNVDNINDRVGII